MKQAFLCIAGCLGAVVTFFTISCNSGATTQPAIHAEDTVSLTNPIPDTIQTSDLVADVEFFTQVPASTTEGQLTRIIKLDHRPGDNDIFIQDLRGTSYRIRNGKPQLNMDIKKLRPNFIPQPGMATGFGSFAFHPDFQNNGLLYTTHTEPPKTAPADFSYPDSVPVVLQWVLTEWKTDPAKFPFIGEGRELLRINMPTGIHGVQEIAFNNKAKPGDEDYGLLYIGVGDGGSVEIHHGLVSRKPSAAWGSILRIDPRGNNSKNGKYGIPASNPFVGNADCAHEVYAYGFRNPHRLNWSRDGRMFAINIGQHLIEALDIVEPGRFYGWPVREGNFLVHTDHINDVYKLPANDTAYHVTYPVAEFDHDEGTAISGGFEYQGSTVPQLQGKYVFGDIGTGTLFYVDMQDLQIGRQATIKKWNIALKGKRTSLAELCHNERVDMRFGMDASGELYLFTKRDGKVWRIVR